MAYLEKLENEISELRNQLIQHPLYSDIKTVDAIQKFMESHVFAVWDFMSLLKALQIGLTNVSIPWTPKGNPITRRLINEIVLGEETDVNELNEPKSHFEMYIDAMTQLKAETKNIEAFIHLIESQNTVSYALNKVQVNEKTKAFVEFTFEAISTNKLHIIAGVFTFGREDLIPDMFIEIVKNIDANSNIDLSKLIYYLERHIEVDGGDHGPMALMMIDELCGQDETKWNEVIEYSNKALQCRIDLWNGILSEIL
jgi:hypothetical protein